MLVSVVFLALRLGGWVKFRDSDWVAWLIVLAPFSLAWKLVDLFRRQR